MEIGESGVNGARAVKRVNKENNQENVNATHLPHSIEGRNVKATQVKNKSATKTSSVQVKKNRLLVAFGH